jgi:hypothetical protein
MMNMDWVSGADSMILGYLAFWALAALAILVELLAARAVRALGGGVYPSGPHRTPLPTPAGHCLHFGGTITQNHPAIAGRVGLFEGHGETSVHELDGSSSPALSRPFGASAAGEPPWLAPRSISPRQWKHET